MATAITDRVAPAPSLDRPVRRGTVLRMSRVRDRVVAATGPRPGQRPAPPLPATVALTSTALAILAALSLSLVAELTFLGDLQHNRAQVTAADAFRADLANATAPVGPLDDAGHLLPAGSPVALLDIPSLGVLEVVGEGTSAGVTLGGPGHRRDSVLPGQAGVSVIAGRSSTFGSPFAQLGNLRAGARVTTTTGQGRMDFTVTSVRRAGDPMPQPLAAGASRLLLVTADGPRYQPTGAVMVDAQALATPFQVPPQVTGAVLQPQERVMSGDTSSANLFALVLWSQVLLATALGLVWSVLRWGRWPTWLVGIPTVLAVGLEVVDHVCRMLPNIL